jgi:hypothetical protein
MQRTNNRSYQQRAICAPRPSPGSDLEYWHAVYRNELIELYAAFASAVTDGFPSSISYWQTNDSYTDFVRMLHRSSSRRFDGVSI